MTNTSPATATNSTAYDLVPCVRYGFPSTSDHPRQSPVLHLIHDPIPKGAETASPIYLLTTDELDRQDRLESPYAVSDVKSIATALQNAVESRGRVAYPVHIESDRYREEGPETLVRWFREFIGDELGVPFDRCTLYFSGNRSIHVHLPLFATSESARESLKIRASEFCEATGADFDFGLYSRKRQFRLPGVVHEETGLSKVRIHPEWSHEEIIRASTDRPTPPPTYAQVLTTVFGNSQSPQTGQSKHPTEAFVQQYGGDEATYSPKPVADFDARVPVFEQIAIPDSPAAYELWEAYNRKEFSPYANATGGERSVAVVKVLGGAFQRKEVGTNRILVPTYFYGAHGCSGRAFTKHQDYAPLQLSRPDFDKWDYTRGDLVVIIGGQSRRSRIFSVDTRTAAVAGHLLDPEEGSRTKVLEYLAEMGFDVGSAGVSHRRATDGSGGVRTRGIEERLQDDDVPSATTSETDAARLQHRAEREGIDTLTHQERWRVACRLLKTYGWDYSWEWFNQRFGSEFKPEVTWTQFQSVIKSYPTDYSHVEVPPRP